MNITLWTWPDREHNDAVSANMCDCDLREWKTRLAWSVEYLEASGLSVKVVTITVAEMLAELERRGLANTPDNRALVAVKWGQK